MKRYIYCYRTIVSFSEPLPRHAVMLRCQPVSNNCQTVEQEQLVVSPDYWMVPDTDAFGNRILYGGANEQKMTFAYISCGIVSCNTYLVKYRGESLSMYKQPTALTLFHVDMNTLLPDKKLNSRDKSIAICHAVHEALSYEHASTDVNTTAAEAFRLGKGVCQDYAHLMLSLCRKMEIPCRYVCGFLEGNGETHAWVEIYDGYNWVGFDPTNDCRLVLGYVKIAHGRDAADCPVVRGMYMGPASQQTTINVTLHEI